MAKLIRYWFEAEIKDPGTGEKGIANGHLEALSEREGLTMAKGYVQGKGYTALKIKLTRV